MAPWKDGSPESRTRCAGVKKKTVILKLKIKIVAADNVCRFLEQIIHFYTNMRTVLKATVKYKYHELAKQRFCSNHVAPVLFYLNVYTSSPLSKGIKRTRYIIKHIYLHNFFLISLKYLFTSNVCCSSAVPYKVVRFNVICRYSVI